LCISIRTLKRKDYLRRCLDSLSANTDLDGVDFFFIQDGAVNPYSGIRYAEDSEIEACLDVYDKADLPNKTIFVKDHNTGTAIHKELQLDKLFPKYEYAVMADNDLVFNKHYIKTLKVLFKQFKDDKNAGMLQTSFRHDGHNFQSREWAEELKDTVTYGFSHRWEQGFWRDSAEKIKPLMRPFFDLIRNVDFREMFIGKPAYKDVRKKIEAMYGGMFAGDSVIEKCAEQAGYKGLHTSTLRHKTIGKRGGYSFRAGRFDGSKFGKIDLYDIGGDVERYRLV